MRRGSPVVGRSPRDREVPGSIPARGVANFLEQEIYLTLLSTGGPYWSTQEDMVATDAVYQCYPLGT